MIIVRHIPAIAVTVSLGALLFLSSIATAQSPAPASKPAEVTSKSGNLSSGFIRLTPDQWEKIKKQKMNEGQRAARDLVCTVISCGPIICVPGCDPPDEHGTITGCSSCYSSYRDCIVECK